MKRRFIQIQGELVEVTRDYTPEPKCDIHVVGDIQPYQSMIDGSVIQGRAEHREHLKRHGCVELGNDVPLQNKQPDLKVEQRKELIRSQIANMRHEDFRRMLRNDLDRIRWESRGRPHSKHTGE